MQSKEERSRKKVEWQRKRAAENVRKLVEYLKSHPCVDCEEGDPIVLEFDHLSNKKYKISELVARGRAWELILEEIAKCEVRCANCHRKKTALQLGYRMLDYV